MKLLKNDEGNLPFNTNTGADEVLKFVKELNKNEISVEIKQILYQWTKFNNFLNKTHPDYEKECHKCTEIISILNQK